MRLGELRMWLLSTGCEDVPSSCLIVATLLGSGCEVIMCVVLSETLLLPWASVGTSKGCCTGAIGILFTELITEELIMCVQESVLPL